MQVFRNENLGEIKVLVKDNKEYFEGTKVAKILGYTNPRKAVRDHCLNDGTIRSPIKTLYEDVNGRVFYRNTHKVFIDEGNLYRLIVRSKIPSAIMFEKWIFDEVIPSIRKVGIYTIDKKETLALLGETVSSVEEGIRIGEFAQVLNSLDINLKTGRNTLYKWFRDNGYIIKQYSQNIPKQIYMDRGLFKVRQVVYEKDDKLVFNTATYITGKGQAYFIKRLTEDFTKA